MERDGKTRSQRKLVMEDRCKDQTLGKMVTRTGDPDPYVVEWLEKARDGNRSQRRRWKRSDGVPRKETKRLLVTTSTWEASPPF